jgi:hypothetical protein
MSTYKHTSVLKADVTAAPKQIKPDNDVHSKNTYVYQYPVKRHILPAHLAGQTGVVGLRAVSLRGIGVRLAFGHLRHGFSPVEGDKIVIRKQAGEGKSMRSTSSSPQTRARVTT